MQKEAQIKYILKDLDLCLDEIRERTWEIQNEVDEIRRLCDTNLSKKEVKRQNFKAGFKYYFPIIVMFLMIF